jgi:hypothetical protein
MFCNQLAALPSLMLFNLAKRRPDLVTVKGAAAIAILSRRAFVTHLVPGGALMTFIM